VSVSAQRFDCDGQLLVAGVEDDKTTIMRPVAIPFSRPFLSPIARYHGYRFDALGFNTVDNYIYAILSGTNDIVRLYSNSTFERIGNIDSPTIVDARAADCTVDGKYMIYDNNSHQMFVFDVVEDFAELTRFELYWDGSSDHEGNFETSLYDIAINPSTPEIGYTFQSRIENSDHLPLETRGYILSIILDIESDQLGKVTPIEATQGFPIIHIGGLLFSPDAVLNGFGSLFWGDSPVQNSLVSINTSTGMVFPGITTSAYDDSDGCSCPYSLTFTNLVPAEGMYCTNDKKTFYLQIANNSYNTINGCTLVDSLPIGLVIDEVVSNRALGDIAGIGTNYLEISNLQIPARTVMDISVKVSSVDAIAGEAYSQAFLYDLPEVYDGMMLSNDPRTVGVSEDASRIYIVPPQMTDFEYETIPPSDCLLANDGIIRVKSPEFIPGEELDIQLLNKMGWEKYKYSTVVDDDNTFELDSLPPGDYQIFQIRRLTDNCSVSIRDNVITLEPPNNMLELEVEHNGPVCEGDSILFDTQANVAGEYIWRGPFRFGPEVSHPRIYNVSELNSGEYTVTLTYGYCEQADTIDVRVLPLIEAQIMGDTVLCERDNLLLEAEGVGDNLYYIWSKDQNHLSYSEQLLQSSVGIEEQGKYYVQVSNGACQDTAEVNLMVLQSPLIKLNNSVNSDFCEPLTLMPIVKGTINASYSWTPEEGLTCQDCLTPAVEPIVQDNYTLIVQNENGCVDSATTTINLDKRKVAYIPNIFLVNERGENGRFSIYPGCVTRRLISLIVYDRWGNQVYSLTDKLLHENSEGWSGYIKGYTADAGSYVWKAELELVDGTIEKLAGTIMPMQRL